MTGNDIAIGIAGTGRVAQALGRLISDRGQAVTVIAGWNPIRAAEAARFIGGDAAPVTFEELRASHVLIAVFDIAIEPVSRVLARSGFHTSGARGPQALTILEDQGVSYRAIHPLLSFSSAEQSVANLQDSVFAIDVNSEALEWASSIATLAGGRSLRIRPELRSLYHAAAVMVSSHIGALIYAAVEIVDSAGVGRTLALSTLAPLIRTFTENALRSGPVEALTGPIDRGDQGAVSPHLKSLRHLSARIRGMYIAAGELVVQMALLRGLPEAKAAQIEEM